MRDDIRVLILDVKFLIGMKLFLLYDVPKNYCIWSACVICLDSHVLFFKLTVKTKTQEDDDDECVNNVTVF